MLYVREIELYIKKSSPVSLNILQGDFRVEIFSKQDSGSQLGIDLAAILFHEPFLSSFLSFLSFICLFVPLRSSRC